MRRLAPALAAAMALFLGAQASAEAEARAFYASLNASLSMPEVPMTDMSLGAEFSRVDLAWLNNGLFILPHMAWNLALSSKLDLGSFGKPVPAWYEAGENVLRAAAFLYPALLPIDPRQELFAPGLALYAAGSLVYFGSWFPLMAESPPAWTKSLIVQLAPAYTPILWLAGMSLMASSPLHFGISLLFIGAHVGEYLLRWKP